MAILLQKQFQVWGSVWSSWFLLIKVHLPGTTLQGDFDGFLCVNHHDYFSKGKKEKEVEIDSLPFYCQQV